jgi:hypothetical protein
MCLWPTVLQYPGTFVSVSSLSVCLYVCRVRLCLSPVSRLCLIYLSSSLSLSLSWLCIYLFLSLYLYLISSLCLSLPCVPLTCIFSSLPLPGARPSRPSPLRATLEISVRSSDGLFESSRLKVKIVPPFLASMLLLFVELVLGLELFLLLCHFENWLKFWFDDS